MLKGVWKSDEKLVISESSISPSKIILFKKQYQSFDTVFHNQMKHPKVRQIRTPLRLRVVCSTLFSVLQSFSPV